MSTAVSRSKAESDDPAGGAGLSWPLVLVSMVAGLMVASAIGLWAYFGNTVFFEIVRTGFAACF